MSLWSVGHGRFEGVRREVLPDGRENGMNDGLDEKREKRIEGGAGGG